MLSTLKNEPLVHFLFIGFILFGLYHRVGEPEAGSSQIEIEAGDVARILSDWQRRWNRSPSPQEVSRIINAQIREEVLYREALSLGMDQHDPVVKRRLAQKMEFMFKDLADLREPSEAELRQLFKENIQRFQRIGRYTFKHVFFNGDQREDEVADANFALSQWQLQKQGEPQGDRFSLTSHYEDTDVSTIARDLGESFVSQLDSLSLAEWLGPIRSAFGAHLVYIETRSVAETPTLDEIRVQVALVWQTQERERLNQEMYQDLLEDYQVNVMLPGDIEATP